ncbi:DUF2637 domain-containing protein [Streptomyces sp. NPDC004111]|uniref:DUF2637 domain-containing protein n=1 Tax=Streptomyces sp. NPDC004111 TaxID=3364690 RepID=UPI0036A04654
MDRFDHDGYFSTQPYVPRAGEEPLGPYDSVPIPAQQTWESAPRTVVLDGWDPDEELAAMTTAAPGRPSPGSRRPVAPAPQPTSPHPRTTSPYEQSPAPRQQSPSDTPDGPHVRVDRRRPRRRPGFLAGRGVAQAKILIVAICVCAACLLLWSIAYTYGQLRAVAEGMLPDAVALWWPLAVYGPWFLAALSIARATMQHRRALRSWAVLLTASAVAVALCVGHSSHSLMAFVMFGIPPVTALVCFWELIGQVPNKRWTRRGAHAPRNPRG